ncbi:unnamed protein product [Lasius platythorax]|uniref:Uncharacterized protein n=1 Tax=Lasius platythorax TaxID=488582 RepID=A0AAV2NQA9_9HYME
MSHHRTCPAQIQQHPAYSIDSSNSSDETWRDSPPDSIRKPFPSPFDFLFSLFARLAHDDDNRVVIRKMSASGKP